MAPGLRRPRLTVCCQAPGTWEELTASLRPLLPVADEVLVAVDAAATAMRDRCAAAGWRTVVPSGLAQVASADARYPWVYTLRPDAIPSPALVAALPTLLRGTPARFAFTRRSITPDALAWFDESPWAPCWEVALTHADADAPLRHRPEAVLDVSTATTPAERRRSRVLEAVTVRAGQALDLRGDDVLLAEPERFAKRRPEALTEAEANAVAAYLGAAKPPGTVRRPAAPKRLRRREPRLDGALEWVRPPRSLALDRPAELVAKVTQPGRARRRTRSLTGSVAWRCTGGADVPPAPIRLAAVGPGDVLSVPVVTPYHQGHATLDLVVTEAPNGPVVARSSLEVDLDFPAALPSQRESRPANGGTIPRVIHRIWLGDAALPEAHVEFGHTWARHHPDWEIRLWTDDDVPRSAGAARARNLAERADLARYAILARHGGVYVDTDVECLRPLDPLLQGVAAFAGYEVPGRLCNAVIGSEPGHAAFEEAVRSAELVAGHGIYPDATATTFLTYLLEAHDGVTLFAPHRFYPELWDGRRSPGDEPPYTAHHWAQSWNVAT